MFYLKLLLKGVPIAVVHQKQGSGGTFPSFQTLPGAISNFNFMNQIATFFIQIEYTSYAVQLLPSLLGSLHVHVYHFELTQFSIYSDLVCHTLVPIVGVQLNHMACVSVIAL